MLINYLHGYHTAEYEPTMPSCYQGQLPIKINERTINIDMDIQDVNGEINQEDELQ